MEIKKCDETLKITDYNQTFTNEFNFGFNYS